MRRFVMFAVMLCAASGAGAVTLDLDNPNGIAAIWSEGDGSGLGIYIVCTDGSGFFGNGSVWEPSTAAPVPLSQVADWTPRVCYTTDGRWFQRGSLPGNAWEPMNGSAGTFMPPPCFVPVGSEAESLGKIKALYR